MPIDSSKQIFHIRLQQGCGNPETIGTLDNVLALRAGGVELLQVDRTGGGQFSELVILTGKEYVDPSDWPPGQSSVAWTYRAVFVDGTAQLSDWSPNVPVAVTAEPGIYAAQEASSLNPDALDQAVHSLNAQMQEAVV